MSVVKNQESRAKSQDSSSDNKLRLDLFKGIMHSLERFEFVKEDGATLIFWDYEAEDDVYLKRNLTLPQLISWIAQKHYLEGQEHGARIAQKEIQKALGL